MMPFYVDGDVTEQPDRMDLLVELINANVHPKLSLGIAQACTAVIAAESALLRAAVESARPARAKLQLFDRVLTAVARSAAIEIGHFKRLLKANGFTEADVHTIIPDHSSAPAKKVAAPRRSLRSCLPSSRRSRIPPSAEATIASEVSEPRLPPR